jgi:hypothetical protein
MKPNSKIIDWYEKEVLRDKVELDLDKIKIINQLKSLKKEDILPKKPEKLTLWQRIKLILMG